MRFVKQNYILEYEEATNEVALYNTAGGRYLKMPASVLFTADGEEILPKTIRWIAEDNKLTVSADSCSAKFTSLRLSFQMEEDGIEVAFEAMAAEDVHVQKTELFRAGRRGMYMVDCIRYFAPAPRNNEGINRAFEKVFCDCTMDAYFAPPPLNFCVGNRSGWIAFGLLDLPNSYTYKMTPRLGILVENRGGKLVTRKNTVYKAPRLLISFPETEWESIRLFRTALDRRGLLPQKREEYPAWWKKPLVVTYGDQMMELQYNWYTDDDWPSPEFTVEWLRMWLERAEKKLGHTDFTVVIDAFWQHPYSAEAKVDAKRFGGLRQFIDMCHAKGHKVLLWSAPLMDNPANGFETLAQKMGVLSKDRLSGGIVDGKYYIDFTSDKISAYFAELSRLFFSSDPDALDCDGLKMDFLAFLRNPEAEVHYQNPENGIGIQEMYRFYDEFQKAAVRVKPDVCLNGSGCDPRFETVMAMNRLHDIQNVFEERELRARASALACPGLIIDSDGAIMLTDWIEETYIKAVVYGTPSLYYVNRFHDGVSPDEKTMKALGALLRLSGEKTDGAPMYDANGDWHLISEGRSTARSFGGETVYVYNGKGDFHMFSWRTGTVKIPVEGFRFYNLPANCTLEGTTLTAELTAGIVCTVKAE